MLDIRVDPKHLLSYGQLESSQLYRILVALHQSIACTEVPHSLHQAGPVHDLVGVLLEFRSGHHEKSYEGQGKPGYTANDHVSKGGSMSIIVHKTIRSRIARLLKLTVVALVDNILTLVWKQI